MVRYLLRVGVDANDPCALLEAVENGVEIGIIQTLLIARSCLPSLGGVSYGVAALHTAIRAADLEIFNILLVTGIYVYAVTFTTYEEELEEEVNEEEFGVIYGETALGIAVREDRGEGFPNNVCDGVMKVCRFCKQILSMRLLLSQVLMFKTFITRVTFITPSHTLVRRLLSVGADPNTAVAGHPGFEDVTLAAVTRAHAPLVKLLIEAGAEVNSPPTRFPGRTPFKPQPVLEV